MSDKLDFMEIPGFVTLNVRHTRQPIFVRPNAIDTILPAKAGAVIVIYGQSTPLLQSFDDLIQILAKYDEVK